MEISLATGLRIGDVLRLKTESIAGASERRITVRELKTGKNRRITLPVELYERALGMSGKIYVFENRLGYDRPRTRQAVFKDLKRAARLFRLKTDINTKKPNVSPHTARKVYAVEAYHKSNDLKKVQKLLNHGREAVTVLYALADELTARRLGSKQ